MTSFAPRRSSPGEAATTPGKILWQNVQISKDRITKSRAGANGTDGEGGGLADVVERPPEGRVDVPRERRRHIGRRGSVVIRCVRQKRGIRRPWNALQLLKRRKPPVAVPRVARAASRGTAVEIGEEV